jgi:hypothetical protein
MPAHFATLAAFALIVPVTLAADGDRQLTIVPPRGLGTIESITLYQTKNGKRESVASATKFDKPLALPNDGPFEVMVKPKGGLAVRAMEKLTVKAGTPHTLKLGDHLGAVEVLGDDLPRAEKIVLTSLKDPGPGAKGHVAIQSAADYRIDMLAPPGAYTIWLIPSNGARPQRVVDNVRVQAGRSVRVGD